MKISYYINDRNRNRYYTILSFIGIGLILWEILIYRKTVVSPTLLIGIIGSVALIASLFEYRPFKRTYSYRGVALLLGLYLTCTLSWGLIACSLYVIPNYYLADTSNSHISEHQIISAGSMSGGRRLSSKRIPYYNVEYNGTTKQLVFSSKYLNNHDKYESLKLEVTQGVFGLDIILNQELIEPTSVGSKDIIFQCAVQDIESLNVITTSQAVIKSSNFIKTINHKSDSLTFHLEFDEEFAIEFAAHGYQSKTILINTQNVPDEEQQNGYLFKGGIIRLIPLHGNFINDTVATCEYDIEKQKFEFQKMKN